MPGPDRLPCPAVPQLTRGPSIAILKILTLSPVKLSSEKHPWFIENPLREGPGGSGAAPCDAQLPLGPSPTGVYPSSLSRE